MKLTPLLEDVDGAHALGPFGVLLRTFEDFRYIGDHTGTARTSTDDTAAPSAVLLFRARAGGKEIHGVDLLHFDEDRPDQGVHRHGPAPVHRARLGDAVLAGLVEEGLAPAPARRQVY